MGEQEYSPTYRQQDVDETLNDHDTRISRLEKLALLVVGYGIAEGGNIVTELAQFF
ncbi:hypothetical protein HAPG_00007 [Halorubrum phage GNf2]|nr:hypothetical protein HAPG_00007 [Halorubrum phage GNf2]